MGNSQYKWQERGPSSCRNTATFEADIDSAFFSPLRFEAALPLCTSPCASLCAAARALPSTGASAAAPHRTVNPFTETLKFTTALRVPDQVWGTEDRGYAPPTRRPRSSRSPVGPAVSRQRCAHRELPPAGQPRPSSRRGQHRPADAAGPVSQQSPGKRSRAESAFANLIASQGNTGNGLQQDKSSRWSCQRVMSPRVFSLKHSVFSNL